MKTGLVALWSAGDWSKFRDKIQSTLERNGSVKLSYLLPFFTKPQFHVKVELDLGNKVEVNATVFMPCLCRMIPCIWSM